MNSPTIVATAIPIVIEMGSGKIIATGIVTIGTYLVYTAWYDEFTKTASQAVYSLGQSSTFLGHKIVSYDFEIYEGKIPPSSLHKLTEDAMKLHLTRVAYIESWNKAVDTYNKIRDTVEFANQMDKLSKFNKSVVIKEFYIEPVTSFCKYRSPVKEKEYYIGKGSGYVIVYNPTKESFNTQPEIKLLKVSDYKITIKNEDFTIKPGKNTFHFDYTIYLEGPVCAAFPAEFHLKYKLVFSHSIYVPDPYTRWPVQIPGDAMSFKIPFLIAEKTKQTYLIVG